MGYPAQGLGAISLVADTTPQLGGNLDLNTHSVLDMSKFVCNGRLTLESGVPISTTDQTSGSIVYFTPFMGNEIGLYDGSNWERHSITETELDISGFSGSTVYDIFGYDNSGTFALTSGSWSGSAVRDVELTTQDGIYVRTGEEDKRYLGTIYANDAGVCQMIYSGGVSAGVGAHLGVWNYYNQVLQKVTVLDNTNSWSYNGAYRAANNNIRNRLSVVVGVAEKPIRLHVSSSTGHTITSSRRVGVGKDITTSNSANLNTLARYSEVNGCTADMLDIDSGYHYYSWIETCDDATCTWYGDNGGQFYSGMIAEVIG